jgi:hypothetical protein
MTAVGDSAGRATLSFYTVIGCHWLSLLRNLHTNLAAVAVIFCRNDSDVAPGLVHVLSRCSPGLAD